MQTNKEQFKGSRILLVEDEDSLAIGLEYNLTSEGYQVTRAADGRQAARLLTTAEFDLVILDIMLPYLNGFELAALIRSKSPQLPILILTARTGVKDRLKGLELGADDYLAKPFHLQELLLRLQGMLKRKMWYKDLSVITGVYHVGQAEINFENLTARRNDQEIRLTLREAMVLKYLIENKGKIVSRQEILEKVWKQAPDIETRTVDNFIVRLRKYFEPNPENPVYIKSIRSAGYMFVD
jgi:two-component system alkaline phosphatase synthesis response regulator PhoP